ncbi:hypothetical protein GCM10018953_15050 [Streptosporangium nondiastaticum]
MRLDHLLSKEHRLIRFTRWVAWSVHAVAASERLAHGALISGALAIRFSGVTGRLVPPPGFALGEWERRLRGVSLVRTHCWVLRKRTSRRAAPLVKSGGVWRPASRETARLVRF